MSIIFHPDLPLPPTTLIDRGNIQSIASTSSDEVISPTDSYRKPPVTGDIYFCLGKLDDSRDSPLLGHTETTDLTPGYIEILSRPVSTTLCGGGEMLKVHPICYGHRDSEFSSDSMKNSERPLDSQYNNYCPTVTSRLESQHHGRSLRDHYPATRGLPVKQERTTKSADSNLLNGNRKLTRTFSGLGLHTAARAAGRAIHDSAHCAKSTRYNPFILCNSSAPRLNGATEVPREYCFNQRDNAATWSSLSTTKSNERAYRGQSPVINVRSWEKEKPWSFLQKGPNIRVRNSQFKEAHNNKANTAVDAVYNPVKETICIPLPLSKPPTYVTENAVMVPVNPMDAMEDEIVMIVFKNADTANTFVHMLERIRNRWLQRRDDVVIESDNHLRDKKFQPLYSCETEDIINGPSRSITQCVAGNELTPNVISPEELRNRMNTLEEAGLINPSPSRRYRKLGADKSPLGGKYASLNRDIRNVLAKYDSTRNQHMQELGNPRDMPCDTHTLTVGGRYIYEPVGSLAYAGSYDHSFVKSKGSLSITNDPLALPSPITKTTATPEMQRDKNLTEKVDFDCAKEIYLRHEARRVRDIDRLFQERDSRRQAFLAKRNLLQDDIFLPTLTTGIYRDDQKNEANNSLEEKAVMENWEVFSSIADDMGRKWERSTISVDRNLLKNFSKYENTTCVVQDSQKVESLSPLPGDEGFSRRVRVCYGDASPEPDGDKQLQIPPSESLTNNMNDTAADGLVYPATVSGGLAPTTIGISQSQSALERLRTSTVTVPGFGDRMEDNAASCVESNIDIKAALEAEAKALATISLMPIQVYTDIPPVLPSRPNDVQTADVVSKGNRPPPPPPPKAPNPIKANETTPSPISQEVPVSEVSKNSTSPTPTIASEQSIPADWKEKVDPKTNRKYYYNTITKKSVWSLADILKSKQEETTSTVVSEQSIPADWKEKVDPKTNRKYYYNTITKKSVWSLADIK